MKNAWRCIRCHKRLGNRSGRRVHIRFARGHEYLVSPPVTSICRGCRHRNFLETA